MPERAPSVRAKIGPRFCTQRAHDVMAVCLHVVRSEDGGHTWRQCGTKIEGTGTFGALPSAAKDQGNGWNNCIAVAPDDASFVALGWVAGPFISINAGDSWQLVSNDKGHLHDDLHALLI